MTIRCSIGTAKVLGLKKLKVDALPTTAYLMVGEHCRFNCGFCAQARESSAREDLLSRVSWPKFENDALLQGFVNADLESQSILQRICFQVVQDKAALVETKEWVKSIHAQSQLPICVSAGARTIEEVGELLDLGVDHISIALDAATPEIYAQNKDGSWEERFSLLKDSVKRFPGHMATHLIVGLGESEEEMAKCIQTMYDLGITVALFAFTPVKGTRLEELPPPKMSQYRRVQVAHDLIRQGLARIEQFKFCDGKIIHFGMEINDLKMMRQGEPFRTSGCSGCNRPYYNETPGKELYNYPRILTSEEIDRAWANVLQETE
ncbi:MAG: radical SAM protein [Bacillota bacterium]|nr:radical SAM protein [Bacillota bacterium]